MVENHPIIFVTRIGKRVARSEIAEINTVIFLMLLSHRYLRFSLSAVLRCFIVVFHISRLYFHHRLFCLFKNLIFLPR